jgi:hypothetical protein
MLLAQLGLLIALGQTLTDEPEPKPAPQINDHGTAYQFFMDLAFASHIVLEIQRDGKTIELQYDVAR